MSKKKRSKNMRTAAKGVTSRGRQKKAIKSRTEAPSSRARRNEGIRQFNVAGRPTRDQFILVYGNAGPRMTWTQRAAAGVPAEKFQQVLAAKQK